MTRHAESVNHLSNYMEYMKELGFEGLELKENPFFKFQKDCVKRERNPSSQRLAGTPEKPEPPPAQAISFNSSEILDLVKSNLEAEIDMVRKKVAQINGENSTEILKNLYKTFHDCRSCRLHEGRTHFVFGEGPPDAKIMFVGEGPGFDEDQQGRPFIGKAGRLLERIIVAMGFNRGEVFIANIVKCRPPNNRTPRADEMSICGSILKRQVEAIKPEIIVALGKTSLGYFKGQNLSIMRLRGKLFNWEGIKVMPTYHPAYVLRNPAAKREVWEDMKAVMSILNTGT